MAQRKFVASSPLHARCAVAALRGGALLPLPWLQAWGRILGAAGAVVPNRQRAVTDLNLRLCFPGMPLAQRRRLTRRSLEETAKTLLELPAIWRWPVERLEALEEGVVGEELLDGAVDRGQGILLLAPHLGNWELLNHFLMRRGQLVGLYRTPRVAELDRIIRAARERTGCILVPATPAGLRPLLKSLRAGHLVVILPDQEPLKAHGVHAPFFGVPALTMTLVSRLLRRTGATPLYVFAERRPGGTFRVHFREAPADLTDADPVRAATALNRGVEACVDLCPEQYLWSYKRFGTAPPGEPTPYRAIWGRRRLRRNPWPPAGV